MANYFLFISRHKVVVKFIFFFINVLGVVFISSKIVSIIFLIQVVFLIFLIPRKRMKIIISSFMTISLTMFVLIHINNSNNFYMIQRLTREIVWDLNPANRGTSVNGKVADDSRLARWKAIFNTGKENLLFGYGTGSESTILKEVHLENNLKESIRRNYNTHNQYIFYILENGILGLLVFLLFLYKNLFSALKRRDYAVITFVSSIIIISAVENYFNRTMGVLAISIFLTFLKEDNAEANSNF
ncbi:O-antigen ligase family protein [Maribacter luteus]|uniref:O-antigen ligase family protein n=1 Tax=Maribacter luteus TaxID=2594478 RepID=UPI0024905DAD|nr:O-antigen ligase family protein [Maribacter luteus]